MNRDRTGPEGKGPRTGRGLGDCSFGLSVKESDRPFRRGLGRRDSGRIRWFNLGRRR